MRVLCAIINLVLMTTGNAGVDNLQVAIDAGYVLVIGYPGNDILRLYIFLNDCLDGPQY